MSYYRPKTISKDTTTSQNSYYNQYYTPQYSTLPTVGTTPIPPNPYNVPSYNYPITPSVPTVPTVPTVQSTYYASSSTVLARPAVVRPTTVRPPLVTDSTIKARPTTISPATITYPIKTSYSSATITAKTSSDPSVRPTAKVSHAEKKTKKKTVIRSAGGQTWEDDSLLTWDPNDFRIFCGDLGNEVTDDLLGKAFQKYKSFLKAHVVRDKRSQKTKGYGFVSFKDPNDFVKAMKEMNGKYIGNRPVKLRKSTWKDRNVDVRRKKPY